MQSEAAACQVKFSVLALTDFGSKVVVVGSEEVLGNWQADHGVELQTSSTTYPLWSNTVQLKSARVEEEVNFKYVIISPSKQIEWERGPNRRFVCRSSGVVETPSAQFGIPVHCLQRRPTRVLIKLRFRLRLSAETPGLARKLLWLAPPKVLGHGILQMASS